MCRSIKGRIPDGVQVLVNNVPHAVTDRLSRVVEDGEGGGGRRVAVDGGRQQGRQERGEHDAHGVAQQDEDERVPRARRRLCAGRPLHVRAPVHPARLANAHLHVHYRQTINRRSFLHLCVYKRFGDR